MKQAFLIISIFVNFVVFGCPKYSDSHALNNVNNLSCFSFNSFLKSFLNLDKIKKFIDYRTYDYIKNKVEGKVEGVQYDSVSQTARYSYVLDNKGKHHRKCWFDNDSTLTVKLDLIKKNKLKGMGIWDFGYDKGYSNFWKVIAGNLTSTPMDNSTAVANQSDSLIIDTTTNASANFWNEHADIEGMLEEVIDYKTVLLFIMLLVVIFGGAGFVIAMFKPETRKYFFSKTTYKVCYSGFFLLFLLVVLRWINIINDLLIALIFGFIAGAVAIYFINKYVEKRYKELP